MRGLATLVFVGACAALLPGCSGCHRDAPGAGDDAGTPDDGLGPVREVADIRYRIRVIGTKRVDAPLPMIIALHGRSGSPEAYVSHFERLVGPVRLVLPYGFGSHPPGYEWFDVSHEPDRTAADFTPGVMTAAKQVAAFVEAVQRAEPTLGKPVLTGFSMGAVLTHAIVSLRPELVSFAAPMSGHLPPGLGGAPPKPGVELPDLVAFHGEDDKLVPITWDEESMRAHTAMGFHVELRRYPGVEHNVGERESREYLDVLDEAARRAGAAR